MRVLHVTHQYAPAIGGAERYITDLSEELARRGHTVEVYTSRATDYHTWANVLPPQATINGVQVRRFDAWPRRGHTWRALDFGLRHYWPGRSAALAALIYYGNGPICPGLYRAIVRAAPRFDLVHINQLHYSHAATAFAAARRAGLPIVTTPHLHAEQPATYDVDYLLAVLRGSQVIFADTAGERDFLLSQGFPPVAVTTAGHGLNLAAFPPQTPAAARAQLGLPEDAFVVLFLGRKTEYKGLEPSLRAFLQLRRTHPNAYFLAVGPETAHSQQLWQTYGGQPGVVARGAVSEEERLAALAACDVLTLPSTGEAFGIVYLEAWAYAKPVIGAPITAVAALIADGQDGFLVPPTQVPTLADRLAWLATHPDQARQMGAAGQAKLHRRFTTGPIADIVEGAYRRALRRHRTRLSFRRNLTHARQPDQP
jgi:glycosyltransferase involved in cell wall biosynthesis